MGAKHFLGPGKRVANSLQTREWDVGIDEARSVRAFERIEQLKNETLDIVVANAGASESAPLAATELAAFQRMIDVNLTGTFLTLREGARAMKGKPWGRMIAIASTAGLSPRPRLSWYNASKGWMITATKAMAVELAPSGVRVNALCPVAGETPPGAISDDGLVDVNQASVDELDTLPRIGPALAGAIVAYRDEHGPFASIDDLDAVSGIGPAMLASLEPLVTF